MRLLVVTQAVDTEDRALGFFHEWLKMLAQGRDLEVVCLKEGAHALPANVRVHSLGKERGVSRLGYLFNFYRRVFSLRYDAVFVHMNEEYVLLAGWWWRLAGKKVVLWRNHKKGSWRTALAAHLTTAVCYTSPEAFVAGYRNAVSMPVGIDTDFFAPPAVPVSGNSVLFLGRVDPVKKAEVFIEALKEVTLPFKASLYGSPTEPNSPYAANVAQAATGVRGLALFAGVPFARTQGLYQSHAIYVNITPSGSFDKTIGEAMASGCLVVCVNDAVRAILPHEFLAADGDARDIARAIEKALALPAARRGEIARAQRQWVLEHHSLGAVIRKLAALL